MLPIRIISMASAHPERVHSSQLDAQFNLPTGTLESIGGVTHRHWANAIKQSTLAAQAISKALVQAQLSLAQIDAIVAANGVPEQAIPCTAALIGRELGLDGSEHIACFDINATCLSFLVALDSVAAQLSSKRFHTVVIVCSDLASRGVDFTHLESAAIFGDGVVATIVQWDSTEHSGILHAQLTTYPQGWASTQIRAGGTQVNPRTHTHLTAEDFLFQMDGRAVFKLAKQVLPSDLARFLRDAQLNLDDFDWIVPHQASHLAMQHMRKSLNIASDKIIDIYRDYGNQVAASLPTALSVGIADGRIQRGQKVLLLGTGAGLSIGFLALQY